MGSCKRVEVRRRCSTNPRISKSNPRLFRAINLFGGGNFFIARIATKIGTNEVMDITLPLLLVRNHTCTLAHPFGQIKTKKLIPNCKNLYEKAGFFRMEIFQARNAVSRFVKLKVDKKPSISVQIS